MSCVEIYVLLIDVIFLCQLSGYVMPIADGSKDSRHKMATTDQNNFNGEIAIEFLKYEDDEAKIFANHFRMDLKCRVFEDRSIYHFQLSNHTEEHFKELSNHKQIVWVERQHFLRRTTKILYDDTQSKTHRLINYKNSQKTGSIKPHKKYINPFRNIYKVNSHLILEINIKKYFNLINKLYLRNRITVAEENELNLRKYGELKNSAENEINSDDENLFSNKSIIFNNETDNDVSRARFNKGNVFYNDSTFKKHITDKDNNDMSKYENRNCQGLDNINCRKLIFNDPQFHKQWYLFNNGDTVNSSYDLNVIGLWKRGITGKGVTVSVLDDGIQSFNREIAQNFNPEVSFSLVDENSSSNDNNSNDGYDKKIYNSSLTKNSSFIHFSSRKSHGTFCAGVIAAVANNGFCGVGVAYGSRIGGVRLLDDKNTDVKEAIALSRHLQKVSIFSASWGPPDDGASVEGPGKLAAIALQKGTSEGRSGKGVLYVWASGNGGYHGDNCNLDGYASSVYTISVSSLSNEGLSTYYTEPCASTLAAVFVEGEEFEQRQKLQNEDLLKHIDRIDGVVVPTVDDNCAINFHGTSAAAPLVAGVLALVLQVNPNLGYRDVQHLLAMTSEPTKEAFSEEGWIQNGVGKWFHLKQGFGAVNAGKLASLAAQWVNVPPMKTVTIEDKHGPRKIKHGDWRNITVSSNVKMIKKLEHVALRVSIKIKDRGKLRIYVVSPLGTISQVLTGRPNDTNPEGFSYWDFVSVHFWGETPKGDWVLCFYYNGTTDGELLDMFLIMHGTE